MGGLGFHFSTCIAIFQRDTVMVDEDIVSNRSACTVHFSAVQRIVLSAPTHSLVHSLTHSLTGPIDQSTNESSSNQSTNEDSHVTVCQAVNSVKLSSKLQANTTFTLQPEHNISGKQMALADSKANCLSTKGFLSSPSFVPQRQAGLFCSQPLLHMVLTTEACRAPTSTNLYISKKDKKQKNVGTT